MKKVSFLSLAAASFCVAITLVSSSCSQGGCQRPNRKEPCGPPCDRTPQKCVPCDACEKPKKPPCPKEEKCPQPSQCWPDECSSTMDNEEASDVSPEGIAQEGAVEPAKPIVKEERAAAPEAAKSTTQVEVKAVAPLSEMKTPVPENSPLVKKDSEGAAKLEVKASGN